MLTHEHDQLKQSFDPQTIIAGLIKHLEEKQYTVISARAGLGGDKKTTLSAIGGKYKLSRERIRQIERDISYKLSDKLHEQQIAYIQLLVSVLDHEGGVSKEDDFAKLLLPKEKRVIAQINALRLFMRLTKDVVEIKDSKTTYSGWVLRVIKSTTVHAAIEDALKVIEDSGAVVDFDYIWEKCPKYHELPQTFLKNAILLSRSIIKTTAGQYGLATWPTVNPKNVRDKIFYVLFDSGKPMHFTDITKKIRENSFDGKKVVQPTVHNELIADERFVLVGRGIYALTQWGYKPGTVEDIIEQVLKSSDKALSTDEIVSEVLKSRHVKKNTIIINLQIKPQFVKVGKKLYTLTAKDQKNVSAEVKKTIKLAEKKS